MEKQNVVLYTDDLGQVSLQVSLENETVGSVKSNYVNFLIETNRSFLGILRTSTKKVSLKKIQLLQKMQQLRATVKPMLLNFTILI